MVGRISAVASARTNNPSRYGYQFRGMEDEVDSLAIGPRVEKMHRILVWVANWMHLAITIDQVDLPGFRAKQELNGFICFVGIEVACHQDRDACSQFRELLFH